MIPIFYMKEQGQRGCRPFPLHPKSPPTRPPLRCGRSRLTIPNTYSTITMPASLRSDCCSPSLRNAVRLPSGIDVHLHRNTHVARQLSSSRLWPIKTDLRRAGPHIRFVRPPKVHTAFYKAHDNRRRVRSTLTEKEIVIHR